MQGKTSDCEFAAAAGRSKRTKGFLYAGAYDSLLTGISKNGVKGDYHAGKMAQNYMGNSGGAAFIGASDDISKLAFKLFYIQGSTAFWSVRADFCRQLEQTDNLHVACLRLCGHVSSLSALSSVSQSLHRADCAGVGTVDSGEYTKCDSGNRTA